MKSYKSQASFSLIVLCKSGIYRLLQACHAHKVHSLQICLPMHLPAQPQQAKHP